MVWVFVALLMTVMALVAYVVIECGRIRSEISATYHGDNNTDIRPKVIKDLYVLGCRCILVMLFIALATSASIALL